MRKDGAFRIYKISYEIRPGKCRYGGVKENKIEKIHIFIFHVGFPALKCFKNICFTLDLEVGTFLYDMVPVSATYVQQFPSTSINPEKCQKTTISVRELGHNFARDSCFDINDMLYARPISSL